MKIKNLMCRAATLVLASAGLTANLYAAEQTATALLVSCL